MAKSDGDTGLRLGIDIGGTFTDFYLQDSEGRLLESYKVPTTAQHPAQGALVGIEKLQSAGYDLTSIQYLVHGSTIGLNALIQRRGCRVVLVATEGFRDVLEIARLRLPVPWNFHSQRPEPLVPRDLVVALPERVLSDGTVLRRPTEVQLREAVDRALALKPEAIAVALLNSYVNPDHETELIAAFHKVSPDLPVTGSADLWPQMREYERTMVAVINAYLQPLTSSYLDSFERGVRAMGVAQSPFITQSNGGVMSASSARRQPVRTILSGPAAGVAGARAVAAELGFDNLVTVDVGGTSADVGLVIGGEVLLSTEEHVGDLPVIVPTVSISSIGAGGGSIMWVDGTGVLRLGPESAGALPGPACYGQGGARPTLTDALLVCGYLDAAHFAGGVHIDEEAARSALGTVATQLETTVEDLASLAVEIAVANMYGELGSILEKHGCDPRDFTLVAYGGAGPLLACMLAEETGTRRVVIPRAPGTLCAQGGLCSEVKTEFVRTVVQALRDESAADTLRAICADLRAESAAWAKDEAPGILVGVSTSFTADMRYVGQSFELSIDLNDEALDRPDSIARLKELFHRRHKEIYGQRNDVAAVECTELRAWAHGLFADEGGAPPADAHRARSSGIPAEAGDAPYAPSQRTMTIARKPHEASVYDRGSLLEGAELVGPALILQDDSTCVIPPGWRGLTGRSGVIVLERNF